ncbi:hypothetical protein BB558_002975 [Smittium angustum]|uniref:5-methyltetrahydropteroyltriglutamate--homocysteine S-methyltransferase n=1 Tax=Smittium angustum TaxID=133377 RepID=A0A2U1J783_SMIAN|nr:hypothetical protein BB558_002975 [Smittium angustum]
MISSSIVGFPRVGSDRAHKFALEKYWRKKITVEELVEAGKKIKLRNWEFESKAGIEQIVVGDFSYYDHILDLAVAFNVIPSRFKDVKRGDGLEDKFEFYFSLARGAKSTANGNNIEGDSIHPLEMTKWFDTNYHCLVPEISKHTEFKLTNKDLVEEYVHAKNQGYNAKPVIVGPATFIYFSKFEDNTSTESKWDYLNKLIPLYADLILELEKNGAKMIQIDEPILATTLDSEVLDAFDRAYKLLGGLIESKRNIGYGDPYYKIKLFLANYYSSYDENFDVATSIDIFDGFHFDLVNGISDIPKILEKGFKNKTLSLGLVDGRNVWKTDLKERFNFFIKNFAGLDPSVSVIINSSCSLLHLPLTVKKEKDYLETDLYRLLSFASEKVIEISQLTTMISVYRESRSLVAFDENFQDSKFKKVFICKHSRPNPDTKPRKTGPNEDKFTRISSFQGRKKIQNEYFNLPIYPTTTIGSFPQTTDIRSKRRAYKSGEITYEQYLDEIKRKIIDCIHLQFELDLDVFVNGEYERTDMVEFFGENLEGMEVTTNGWVQSYGSRYVKPPIIFAHVYRGNPMTCELMEFTLKTIQSVLDSIGSTKKKYVKAILTGPVTIVKWSFPRNDIPISEVTKQVAMAIREEVIDLEAIGVHMIQVDEPAIREGLPLKKKDQDEYKQWAIESFRTATSGINDFTQIHTHMCYSDFYEIIEIIKGLDVDVLTIESVKSNMKFLNNLVPGKENYEAGIGPGAYDVHSPAIPSKEEIIERIKQYTKYFDKKSVWINPDCGNKTRTEAELKPALQNMIAVAKQLRIQEGEN